MAALIARLGAEWRGPGPYGRNTLIAKQKSPAGGRSAGLGPDKAARIVWAF